MGRAKIGGRVPVGFAVCETRLFEGRTRSREQLHRIAFQGDGRPALFHPPCLGQRDQVTNEDLNAQSYCCVLPFKVGELVLVIGGIQQVD